VGKYYSPLIRHDQSCLVWTEFCYFSAANSLNSRPQKIKINKRRSLVTTQTAAEAAMAEMLVEVLNLEDIEASEIDPNQLLFGEGLGLDSIDALEIALAISQQYGVEMKAEDESTREAFATLRSLCGFVANNR
jgi:acyl carrier protein